MQCDSTNSYQMLPFTADEISRWQIKEVGLVCIKKVARRQHSFVSLSNSHEPAFIVQIDLVSS